MVERARIFLVEDDPIIADSLRSLMWDCDHQVIIEANTVPDALKQINKAREEEIILDVAIVDGNLGSSRMCSDGKQVAQALREKMPTVPIIAHSAAENNLANYGDVYVRKGSRGSAKQILAFTKAL